MVDSQQSANTNTVPQGETKQPERLMVARQGRDQQRTSPFLLSLSPMLTFQTTHPPVPGSLPAQSCSTRTRPGFC